MSDASSTDTLDRPTRAGGEPLPLALPPGTRIGRYVILGHLGAGGMGTVHLAWDGELQRKIALKLVRPERKAGEGAEQARARFLREAQALAQVGHPNVVTVFDAGLFGDEVFLAMELVEGRDLREHLAQLPPVTDPHRWPRVLEVFREIAAGLGAVHQAGLVHRDLKPANVMVGKDGRARVMDFGLARRIAEPEVVAPAGEGVSSSSPLDARLTSTGLRLGTPSYMSPEQRLGLPCDARSDVFSFSIALYEALYGRRPLGEAGENLLTGPVLPAPAGSPVPAELHPILLRGLARDPAERWTSPGELLAAAGRVAEQRRRRPLLAAAAAGLLLLAGLFYGLRRYQETVCGDAETRLASVFGAAQKTAIAAAFRRLGASFGPAGDRLAGQLEDWGGRWAAQRRDACEATHRRGEQSEELLDRRIFCLDQRLAELRAAAGLLAAADLAVAENPRAALDLLGDLEACADPVQLSSGSAWPPAAQREEARRIQQQLIDARGLAARGEAAGCRRLATAAIDAAARLAYPPLLAEARLTLCRRDIEDGRADSAATGCMAAAAAAVAGGDDPGLANAAAQLAELASEVLGKPHEGAAWLAIADAAAGRLRGRPLLASSLARIRGLITARLGDGEAALAALRHALELAASAPGTAERQAVLYDDLGTVLGQLGRFPEAETAYKRALELGREVYGPDHPTLAWTLNNLGSLHWSQTHYEDALQLHLAAVELLRKSYGNEHRLVALSMNNVATALRELGRHEEADRYLLESIAILERVLGPDHVDLATALGNLAFKYRLAGELDQALPLYERAHRIFEKNLPADNFALANSHQSLGITLAKMKRYPEALEHLEKCNEVYHRVPTDPRSRGTASYVLAKVSWDAGKDRARSRRLVQEALADFETDPARMSREIAMVEKWLAEHP